MLHVLFWCVSLGYFFLLFSRNTGDQINTFLFIAGISPITIIITYLFNYYFIPNFLNKGQYFKFIWYSVATGVVGVWLALIVGVIIWVVRADLYLDRLNRNMLDVPMLIASLFFVVLMGVSVKLIRVNFQVQQQKDLSEKERLLLDNQLKLNELRLLKEQLNPHFLFNTLNNIYGLTLEKSDKAPDLVMRLSNILDYMLYRTDTALVPLKQEVEMVENYISIEKHRFEGRYPISFNVTGELHKFQIAPLLLLPLVENCFKHGIRKSLKHSFVEINLETNDNSIIFRTSNSFGDEKSGGGIGLVNLKKRLEMIYHGKYELIITDKGNEFETLLTIQLTD